MGRFFHNLAELLEMIKIGHSVLALPFAFMGALLAARGLPDTRTLFFILMAMVGARSAAMAFNRLADAPSTPPIPAPPTEPCRPARSAGEPPSGLSG